MSSQIRTALFGLGVIAVCFMLASLKGHHLLMAFAGASLVCGIWSWMQHSQKPSAGQMPGPELRTRRSRNNPVAGPSNVYPFPVRGFEMSDASGS